MFHKQKRSALIFTIVSLLIPNFAGALTMKEILGDDPKPPVVNNQGKVLGSSTGTGDFTNQVINTTNTQAVITYTAPDSNPCKVQVSENSSFNPLSHDVNPGLFTNADLDTKTESLSSGNKRIFVVGKRLVEKGLNGSNYSRALQTNTLHYYKITCGTKIGSGTFTTANIPFGMTYSDGIQNNPTDRAGYDGALAFGGNGYSWSSAGFHEWCSPKVSANGFFRCMILNNFLWAMYGMHQTTGEVRYLGSPYFRGQANGVTEGFRSCNAL